MANLDIDYWDQSFIEWEETILEREDPFINEEKESGKYYLGATRYLPNNNGIILLEISVSVRTFLLYPFHEIITYLSLHSMFPHRYIEYCDIIQLEIGEQGVYTCIIKTYWLRLVQRTWKRVFQEKCEYRKKIKKIENLEIRAIGGRFSRNIGKCPSLRGLMSKYRSIQK
jgi:hypothetical protein